MYETASEPTRAGQVSPKREAFIRIAIERLEKLTEQSEALTERLKSTFHPVLVQRSTRNADRATDCPPVPGSDLGQTLMRLADRLDRNFIEVKELAESADL